MIKSDLIQLVAHAAGVNPAGVRQVLAATLHIIQEAVAKGEAVQLAGFGKFFPVSRPARPRRNPSTGAPVMAPPTTVPRFHVGAGFKAAVVRQSVQAE